MKKTNKKQSNNLKTILTVGLIAIALAAGIFMVTNSDGQFTNIFPKAAKKQNNAQIQTLFKDVNSDLTRIDADIDTISKLDNMAAPDVELE